MDAHRKIELLVVRLAQDLRNRLGSAAAAKSVGIEPTYFSRQFQRVTGMTFSGWNRAVRVEVAKQLLRHTRFSVARVAREVGYEDVTTFERNFRTVLGISPKRYQLDHRRREQEDACTRNAEKITSLAEKISRNADILTNNRR